MKPRKAPRERKPRESGWQPPAVIIVIEADLLPIGLPPTPVQGVFKAVPSGRARIRSLFPALLVTRAQSKGVDLFGIAPPEQVYQLEGGPLPHLLKVARLLVARGYGRVFWPRPRFGPQPAPLFDQHADLQGYLATPAATTYATPDPGDPWGVGARAVEEKPQALGDGARLLIVERGWHLLGCAATPQGHPDCPVVVSALRSGVISGGVGTPWGSLTGAHRGDRFHGLANLGIVCGTSDNGQYGRGIAPRAEVRLHSSHDPLFPADGKVHEALLEALLDALPGDIILVEEQLEAEDSLGVKYPCMVERDPLVYLLLAWLSQIVGALVVEPAGNGGRDLADLYLPVCGLSALDFGTISGRPLVVGGAIPVSRNSHYDSNWGARVDAFAWGSNAYHIKFDASASTASPTWQTDYGGTSAASAIIAGAAVAAQGMVLAVTGSVDTPDALRTRLLSSSTTTTTDAAAKAMGIMPDLGAIATSLGL